jgi:hypothetical protein
MTTTSPLPPVEPHVGLSYDDTNEILTALLTGCLFCQGDRDADSARTTFNTLLQAMELLERRVTPASGVRFRRIAKPVQLKDLEQHAYD